MKGGKEEDSKLGTRDKTNQHGKRSRKSNGSLKVGRRLNSPRQLGKGVPDVSSPTEWLFLLSDHNFFGANPKGK